MPESRTSERVRRRLASVRRAREAFLLALPESGVESFSRSPGGGMWSTLQVLEHVVRAERSVLAGLFDAAGRLGRRRTLKDRVLYGVVIAVLRLNVRVPVVSADMKPTGDALPGSLLAEWDERLGRVEAYVEEATPADLRRAVCRHPVAGPLDLGRALRLDELHIRAHRREVRPNAGLGVGREGRGGGRSP